MHFFYSSQYKLNSKELIYSQKEPIKKNYNYLKFKCFYCKYKLSKYSLNLQFHLKIKINCLLVEGIKFLPQFISKSDFHIKKHIIFDYL